jgi:SAM-dependent methyltransferase
MSLKDRLRDFYGRVYGFNTHNRAEWVAACAARVSPGAVVLDIGAGAAQYRALFAHCDYRTQDFAQEPQTLALGAYARLDYTSDIVSIPLPDRAVDVILCTEVLEHVPNPVAAIREMARLLKPGGRLLLTAPLGSFLHQEPYHFYGGYTPHWYDKFLREAGFTVEAVERNQGFFSLFGQEAVRFRQLLSMRSTRGLGALDRLLLALLWLLTLPMALTLPLLGHWLDRKKLESIATVGYHVIATKRTAAESS